MTEPEQLPQSRYVQAEKEFHDNRDQPRLGRRESEPHSLAISYLYNLIQSNCPEDRGFWDLHHYFDHNGEQLDIQFDISYFRNFSCKEMLPSYKAREFGGRVPTMAINVLSRSTYMKDLSVNLDLCLKVQIPLYIVFFAYPVAPRYYSTPFLRVYHLDGQSYRQREIHSVALDESGKLNSEALLEFSEMVPFKLGLIRTQKTYYRAKPVFLLGFFSLENEVFLTKAEMEKARADEEKARADKLQAQLNAYQSKK
jgi:hypothetical protein